jgi:DNA invertase Pin-like site-specific DNA recombinase
MHKLPPPLRRAALWRDIGGGRQRLVRPAGPTAGYARASSIDQDLSLQRAALKAGGGTIIRAERASGASRKGRSELETLLEFLRPGDTLIVTRIDPLARSLRDLQNIVHELREKGVHLKAPQQPVDTTKCRGQGVLVDAGRLRRGRERLEAGTADGDMNAAKARGLYKGRNPASKPTRSGASARRVSAPPLLQRSSVWAVRVCIGS